LVSGVLICRPDVDGCQPNPHTVTLLFMDTPEPAKNGLLTVTATGDIDNNTMNESLLVNWLRVSPIGLMLY
jgi:hypothetical protein